MLYDREIYLNSLITNPSPSIGYKGELEISRLRISFNINKTGTWSANTASIRIWNISESKRNQLSYFGDLINLMAGYRTAGGAQLIFKGNSSSVSHSFSPPEVVTTINCNEGERNLYLKIANASFGENTPVRNVIDFYARELELDIVENAPIDGLVYSLGHQHSGLAYKGLQKACDYANLEGSVQNGNLVLLPKQGSSTKPPEEISMETGMIGVPERYTDRKQYLYQALPPNAAPRPGWKVRSLLKPQIIPGDRIHLISRKAGVNGIFRVVSINHQGDNYGDVFESLIEVLPL